MSSGDQKLREFLLYHVSEHSFVKLWLSVCELMLIYALSHEYDPIPCSLHSHTHLSPVPLIDGCLVGNLLLLYTLIYKNTHRHTSKHRHAVTPNANKYFKGGKFSKQRCVCVCVLYLRF
ncbi:hypothetical protein AMECASPLE_014198 [Ameca splendens]|uniref:Uncharacterized protein n=1 Tax=Ameca splendens TaxID=208324 RepID=A0ABV0Z108_9TELE